MLKKIGLTIFLLCLTMQCNAQDRYSNTYVTPRDPQLWGYIDAIVTFGTRTRSVGQEGTTIVAATNSPVRLKVISEDNFPLGHTCENLYVKHPGNNGLDFTLDPTTNTIECVWLY